MRGLTSVNPLLSMSLFQQDGTYRFSGSTATEELGVLRRGARR